MNFGRGFRENGYFLQDNGEKCFARANGIELSQLPRDAWYTGKWLYRGLKNLDLAFILRRFAGIGGLPAMGMSKDCIPHYIDAGSTSHGITLYHHLSKNPHVGASFVLGEGNISSGVLLVVNIPDNVGIDLLFVPKYINAWGEEEEVAVPGFIYAHEVVMVIEIKNYKISQIMINDFHTPEDLFMRNILRITTKKMMEMSRDLPMLSSQQIESDMQVIIAGAIHKTYP
jgi:hypothetical protein